MEVASNQEIDFMLLPQSLSLDADRIKDKITEDSANPGFVYVCLDEEQDGIIIETWKDCCMREDGKLYLSSDLIVQNFYEVIKQVCFHTIAKAFHKVNIIRQGPAVTISLKLKANMENKFRESSMKDVTSANTSLINTSANTDDQADYDFEFDLVLAIPCRSWPLNQISGFIERIHQSPTLIQSEINNYYKFGGSTTVNFHIVPKCSNNVGRYEKLEWRLSFSLLEKAIFRDLKLTEKLSLNFGYAFQALKNWKVMISHKYNKVVCSYHLKTAFFWTIEVINDQIYSNLLEYKDIHPGVSEIEEKLEKTYLLTANIFTWLLDVFTNFIKQKHMPHYFCNNFNLLQNKASKELDTLCEQVEILKQNPSLVFQEILKHSSTVKRKFYDTNVLFLNKSFLFFNTLPQYSEFQWVNARTGEREGTPTRRHFGKRPSFVINLLK